MDCARNGASPPPLSYRRKLLFLLSAATFFEGYDGFVLGFLVSAILSDFGGSTAQAGLVRAVAVTGSVAAAVLAGRADRIGRRRLLLLTVTGYTLATAVTAASVNLVMLAVTQFIAQVFLGAEWAVAMSLLAEEVSTGERGRKLGILASMGTLGGVTVGLVAFAGLGETPLGWRAFYLVGIAPLVLVAVARRRLLESELFTVVRGRLPESRLAGMLEPWRSRFRATLIAIGCVHFFRYLALSAAVFWWPFYAQREVGLSVSVSGLYLAFGGLMGVGGFWVAGRLMDAWGRSRAFACYMIGAFVLGVALFQSHSPVAMLPLLCGAIFFGLGSGTMTSAFATEGFPTYIRCRAATWARNVFEIPGGVLGPLIVGWLSDNPAGPIRSVGDAVTLLFLITIVPLVFIAWRFIPETKGRDLAALDAV